MTGQSICIIPARGGSKRIPRKNIRDFAGKPLIAHSIAAAHASKCFGRVIVSTDDTEIARIAADHGAETPFLRDPSLADDNTTTSQVLLDAIDRMGGDHEFTCCIYPTAPLLQPSDLAKSLERLRDSDAYTLIATTEFDYPPLRALAVDDSSFVTFRFPEQALVRSQDLRPLVHDAGMFYWLRTAPFHRHRAIVGERTLGYPMDRLNCVDIDNEEDWRFAEQLYAFHHNRIAPGIQRKPI